MARKLLIIEKERPADLDLYREAIAAAAGDALEIVTATSEAEALARCDGCTAIAGKAQYVPASVVARLPELDWIQALTTGVDPLVAMRLDRRVTISSVRGIHGPQMAELAFLLMLAALRRLPAMLANQAAHRWRPWPQPLLAGKTVLIVGIGLIAEAIAARCLAFDMRVTGASGSRHAAPGFARVFAYSALAEAVAEADIVVVVTPYSSATHHLVDAAAIAAMKRSAVLINIARGNVVDEAALRTALAAGTIAGAGVDVFATEPLPADDPMWDAPNAILTPHIGGFSETYADQVAPVLAGNARAYAAGEWAAMVNVVRAAAA